MIFIAKFDVYSKVDYIKIDNEFPTTIHSRFNASCNFCWCQVMSFWRIV